MDRSDIIFFNEEEIEWEKHPEFKGVFVKKFVDQANSNTKAKTVLVKTLKGIEIPTHIHKDTRDIIYPLSGKATIYIEGIGEYPYVPGACISVPANIPHRVFDVEETIIAYDVFVPEY